MALISFRQSLIRYAAVSVVVLICALLLLNPAARRLASDYNENSLEQKARLDFQIPSPDHDQVIALSKEPFIEAVFPYYDVFSTVQLPQGKKLSNYYIMLVEDAAGLPFIQSALQIEKENSLNAPSVYADFGFVKKYGSKKGDLLGISLGPKTISAPIGAIIENCSSLTHNQQSGGDEALIVSVPPAVLEDLSREKGSPIQYSGAYLRVKNHSQAKEFLRNYKPLARRKPASLFKSDSDYQAYLNGFNSTSYEAEIRDMSNKQSLSQEANVFKNAFLIMILVLGAVILCAVVPFSAPSMKKDIENRIRNGEEIKKMYNKVYIPILLSLLWSILLYGAMAALAISSQTIYCPFAVYLPFVLISLGGIFIFGLFFSASFAKIYTKKFISLK
jgi:hypothetical protein